MFEVLHSQVVKLSDGDDIDPGTLPPTANWSKPLKANSKGTKAERDFKARLGNPGGMVFQKGGAD